MSETTEVHHDPLTRNTALTVDGRIGVVLAPTSLTALAGMTLQACSEEDFADSLAMHLLTSQAGPEPSDSARLLPWHPDESQDYSFEDSRGTTHTVSVGFVDHNEVTRQLILEDVIGAAIDAFSADVMARLLDHIRTDVLEDDEVLEALGKDHLDV